MNIMNILRTAGVVLKKPTNIILTIVVIMSIALAALVYRHTIRTQTYVPTPLTAPIPTLPTSPTRTSTILPPQDPTQIQGIDVGTSASADQAYPGISWFRISYPTCGLGDLKGQKIKDTIQNYHSKGVRILFVICQVRNVDSLDWNSIAQAHPDAVQCGNEEMKQDPSVAFLYMPPAQFARFYDRCERSIHAVNPQVPVLIGSLDPHVAGADYQLMLRQTSYLEQMQQTMNIVRPGSGWNWHTQTLGLIDSWYNGYRGANNLLGVFDFWAQQFNLDVNRGQLGKHLWVVEGTACYNTGCGINRNDPAQVAIVHILTLITDIQTSLQAHVPFFHFSGNDIPTTEGIGPIGVRNVNGHPKPLRQDQAMGTYKLLLTCSKNVHVTVIDQQQLMTRLYARCTLPSNYFATLSS